MATKLKKQKRRERRRKARSVPSEFYIVDTDGGADCALVLEAAEDEDGKPKVHKFSMTAYNGGKLDLGAFFDPVVVDLSGLKISAKSRPILRDHDSSRIVGHTENIQINAGSIKVSGVVSAANETADEIVASSLNGFPWQASIGVRATKMAFVDKGETVKVNGRTFSGPLFVARQSALREVSFVALGADDTTSAKIAASAHNQIGVSDMKFEQWLEAGGWKIDELSDSQKVTLQASYDAEIEANDPTSDLPPADPPVKPELKDDIEAQLKKDREARATEVKRCNSIAEICAKYNNPKIKINNQDVVIEALAIEDGWTTDKTELEAMRADRPEGPAGHTRSEESDCTQQAMEASLILQAGVELDDPCFNTMQAHALSLPSWLRAGVNDDQRQKAMEWGHRFSDMSLVDLCGHAIRVGGGDVPNGRQNIIEAAFSGGTLTNIFTTSVNATLLASFNETGDTTGGWTQSTDVPDFKTNDRPRLQKGANLEKLPRGGSADHYDATDQVESYKIFRYAKQFVIDDQDAIDDMMNALFGRPREMGKAAARLRPDLVYAIMLSNPTLTATGLALFDNATNGNLSTTAALTSANLIAAIGRLETVQENSVNLGFSASHLIVPSELKHTASELLNSSNIQLGADDESIRGTLNTIKSEENLTLVSDARLSNGVTNPDDGVAATGSTTDWYIASNNGPTIEVAYLRGSGRAPQSTSWRKNGEDGQWLLGWSIKLDIGAKAMEWRTMDKSEA